MTLRHKTPARISPPRPPPRMARPALLSVSPRMRGGGLRSGGSKVSFCLPPQAGPSCGLLLTSILPCARARTFRIVFHTHNPISQVYFQLSRKPPKGHEISFSISPQATANSASAATGLQASQAPPTIPLLQTSRVSLLKHELFMSPVKSLHLAGSKSQTQRPTRPHRLW